MQLHHKIQEMASKGKPRGPRRSINVTREEASTCLMNPGRTTVHYDAVTLKPHGRVVADVAGGGRARADFIKTVRKFGTWNVRSMYEGKLEMVVNEMQRYALDLVGISELRLKERGHMALQDDYKIHFSGNDTAKRNGVDIICRKKMVSSVLGYNPISDRIMTLRISAKPMNITFIQVYAPTSDADEAVLDDFYEQLQECYKKVPSKGIPIIMGDLNAKVGTNSQNDAIGPHALGTQNESGTRLSEFCVANGLAIANMMFTQHAHKLYRWISPDGRTRNQIDYIIIPRRWMSSCKSCKTLPGADCGTDHQLLMAKFKTKLKTSKRKPTTPCYDLSSRTDIYTVSVSNRFDVLLELDEELGSSNEIWEKMKDAILCSAKETLRKPNTKKINKMLSSATIDLVVKCRELKSQDHLTNRRRINDLTRDIRRTTRQDKNNYLNEKCKEIETNRQCHNTRTMHKLIKEITTKPATRLSVIKDVNGNVLTESSQIKARWKEYCESLYEKDDQISNVPPISSTYVDEPEILLSEVSAALKKMKKHKSPGIDDIPAELLKATGVSGEKIFLKLCNRIWSTKEWPDDWTKSLLITLPKKGDTRECKNNRTISLISHASKILLYIIAARLENHLNRELPPTQAGFRKSHGTRDQIANMRWIIEKAIVKEPTYFHGLH